MTGRHVLVIDDNAQSRKLLRDIVLACGHGVDCVASGAEGLARIGAGGIDLLILDIMMPGMDGFEVVRQLKAGDTTGRLPILVVTALDDDGAAARLAAAGVRAQLAKPVDRRQLKAALDSLLAAKGGAGA
jgi:CheY-like chemotaxis protein